MDAKKSIPAFTSYEEMEEFCDTHDLGEYWEQTDAAHFEISPQHHNTKARWGEALHDNEYDQTREETV